MVIDYTRKILNEIRKQKVSQETIQQTLNESQNSDMGNAFVVSRNDVQFGSVRSSQEDAIRKTIGDVTLKPEALKYYPQIQDLVLNGEVSGLGVTFQFRYKDPSGDGCYIWAEGLQMTDANLRTVEKIRDAFLNWKQSLIEDGDLMQKLDKQARRDV